VEKYKAIPEGYMTVGTLAKKMNTTIRTLQYYDKEGLLSPSAESAGGLWLYSDKDVVKLHQIQSLKYLGFPLEDIKTRLVSLDTPEDVANELTKQAGAIREKLISLTEALHTIEALKTEVLQMQSVDFKKYSDIIINLQIKNKYYWAIKHFDEKTLDDLQGRFDKEEIAELMASINNLLDKALQFQRVGVKPESEDGQEFAKSFWDKMMEATGGDANMFLKIAEISQKGDKESKKKQETANKFIQPALEFYFKKMGYSPFEK